MGGGRYHVVAMKRACAPRGRRPGFTLIETVVVLLIVALLIAMAAAMTRGVMAAQQRALTATRIAGIDAALAQFVSTQRRLPCPARGLRGPGDDLLGTEEDRNAGGCTTNQANGVVPFRALGLVELDALDGWGRRLTYRVDPALAADNALDMTACDQGAGGSGDATVGGGLYRCNAACSASTMTTACTKPSRFLTNNGTANGKGLQVRTMANTVIKNPSTDPHTGAAYVIISAGETGGGALMPSGVVLPRPDDSAHEVRNYPAQPFTNNAATFYVDDAINDTAGANHFDDVLSHPTVMAVVLRAGLGPRPHY